MAIASRLKWFLDSRGAKYDLLPHQRSACMLAAARSARVPGDRVAKSVLLEDERGYVMAVLPASERIALAKLNDALRRDLELASEAELEDIFTDCEPGAVPAIGAPYGVPTVIEDSLLKLPEVYFEAGDHADLVHMHGAAFLKLLTGARHGQFTLRRH